MSATTATTRRPRRLNAVAMRLGLTALVCACVFKISAGHIIGVAIHYGNTADNAVLYPVCIDAMILVSALYLAANIGVSKMTKFYAKIGRYFGFAATIFCNVAASNFSSTIACIIALIPAISLIIVIELLIHGSKKTAATRKR